MPTYSHPGPEFAPETPLKASAGTPGFSQARLESQLTSPVDVQQAHRFFQPAAQAKVLPDVTVVGRGAEAGAAKLAMTDLSASQLAVPGGNDAISPAVQMIMKIPGAMGLDFLNSFFEWLASLFQGDGLLALFDPAVWAAQAQGALSGLTTASVEHLPIDPSLLPKDAPILQSLPSEHLRSAHDSLNVGGTINGGKPAVEPWGSGRFNQFNHGSLVTIDGNTPAYEPTLGGFDKSIAEPHPAGFNQMGNQGQVQPVTQPKQGTAGQPASHHKASAQQSGPRGHHGGHRHHPRQPGSRGGDHVGRGGAENGGGLKRYSLLESPDPVADQSLAAKAVEASKYTVKSGDCLWDIARDKLGDATRWHEIYQMNVATIGDNPRLIVPGQELNLPKAGDRIADAGRYVVKSGDNLWDIARHKLGDGQRWPEIYRTNESVIGTNPRLIQPGQELNLS